MVTARIFKIFRQLTVYYWQYSPVQKSWGLPLSLKKKLLIQFVPKKEMQEFQENLEGETEGESVNGSNEMTFTLKRSGKTIRRLSAGKYLFIWNI